MYEISFVADPSVEPWQLWLTGGGWENSQGSLQKVRKDRNVQHSNLLDLLLTVYWPGRGSSFSVVPPCVQLHPAWGLASACASYPLHHSATERLWLLAVLLLEGYKPYGSLNYSQSSEALSQCRNWRRCAYVACSGEFQSLYACVPHIIYMPVLGLVRWC